MYRLRRNDVDFLTEINDVIRYAHNDAMPPPTYIDAYTYTVPNVRSLTIWGGIYLEGAGFKNTDWETDGTNNATSISCTVNHPLTLQLVTPNAHYREKTEVITSYWVKNAYSEPYLPDANVSVRFRVYDKDSTLLMTLYKNNVVVPGSGKNLVYFKWKVPVSTPDNVILRADIVEDGSLYNTVKKTA